MISSQEIDKKVEPILRVIETNGVLLDIKYLNELKVEFSKRIEDLAANIYQQAETEFNIDSPKQLAKVLYEDLGLAIVDKVNRFGEGKIPTKKTKTHLSTAYEELKKIEALHPVIALILAYREAKKLLSTYIEPLPKLVDDNGRLHTTYAIDTSSGRLSSKNPNLQNIPIKTKDGKRIRAAFIAPKGKSLLAVDYSQMQLRIVAHFSGDETLINAFKNNEDIHEATAKKMSVERYVAKTINFGVLFGQGPFALAGDLGLSTAEAQNFISQYFLSFPRLANWISEIKKQAHETGQVTTMFGRARDLSEELAQGGYRAGFAERVAINHPIQGTEADIMKLAMIEIHKNLSKNTKIVLQVHDELVFEVADKEGESEAQKIIGIMENVVTLKVPLKTEYKIGKNWSELK